MTPVIQSSIRDISFIPGTAFATKKKNCLTRCSIVPKSTKQILSVQKYTVPLSTSVRLFPQLRSGCSLHPKSRNHILSATGTDVVVEEQDSPVADGEALGAPSDAVGTGEKSSVKLDASSTPAQSKRSRPVRKSEMPPVKNEELVPGATFTGKVKSIQPFGAFVDFGAFTDGLVHVSRMSENFVRDVGSVVSVGQEVKVRLVEANTETGRISLTMRESDDISKLLQQKDAPASNDKTRPPRRNTPKPNQKKDFVQKSSKFVKGQDLEGMVKNLTRAGAFISLPEGEEGFLPTSEESVEGFGNIMGGSSLQAGQEVKVRVLRITRGQVTLTMKKEEDVAELDSKLSQGIVHSAINPFVMAFRQNKDIAAFLDQMEKEEALADNAVISNQEIEKIGGKVNQTETGLDDPEMQDKSMSSNEELVGISSAVDAMEENEVSSKEADVSVNMVDDASTGITNKVEDPESVLSDSSHSLDGAVQSIEEEGDVNSEILDPKGGISNEDHIAEAPPPLVEAENDGEPGLSGPKADQTLSLEVTESQSDDAIVKDEVQIQTLSEKNEIPPATPLEEEIVGPNPEKNSSITSSNEQIDGLPPSDSTTKESQVSEEVLENQRGNSIVNDEMQKQTPAADGKKPSATAIEGQEVRLAPEKLESVANTNGKNGAPSQKEVAAKGVVSVTGGSTETGGAMDASGSVGARGITGASGVGGGTRPANVA